MTVLTEDQRVELAVAAFTAIAMEFIANPNGEDFHAKVLPGDVWVDGQWEEGTSQLRPTAFLKITVSLPPPLTPSSN